MLPSVITALVEMPTLFVGDAVDRVALPLPDWAAAEPVYVAPVNGLEAELQAIWQDVLGRAGIGTYADFFGAGGTNTTVAPIRSRCLARPRRRRAQGPPCGRRARMVQAATRHPAWRCTRNALGRAQAAEVMTRVRKATGAAVPTAALFRAPTIADLAGVLAGMPRGEAGAVPRAPFTAAQKAAGVPCSSNMQGMGRTALEAPEQVACANIPVTLRLAGALDLGALRAAVALLVARHEPLRTRFVVRSGEVLQAVAPADDPRAAPQLAVEQAPAGGAAALMARLEAEASRPFDLFEDRSLMRCLLLTAGEDESTLMVCVHHAGAPARGRCACPARCPATWQGRARGPRLVPVASARATCALLCWSTCFMSRPGGGRPASGPRPREAR